VKLHFKHTDLEELVVKVAQGKVNKEQLVLFFERATAQQ
jgi:hypothetical protein